MKKLVLTRAVPGAGKSTFIENNKLSPYTLSPDVFRMIYGGLVMSESGEMVIDQNQSKTAWDMTYKVLEERMSKGEFVIVDATHLVTKGLNQYKKLAEKYRYRVYMLDFMNDVSYEEILKRDELREEYKKVGKDVIDRMYKNYLVQEENGLPNWLEVVYPNEFEEKVLKVPVIDLSEYKKVNLIGDIHGSYTALMDYLNGRLKDDEFYIFTGDYFERGIENVEVANYLLNIYTKKNVILLEGNHELYMWQYANNEKIRCREFSEVVAKEFDEANIDKKDLRRLYRKLRVQVLFNYNGKEVLVTHGGLTAYPKHLSLVSDTQIIRGVGGYELDVDEIFNENVIDENVYQVHGHRNLLNKDVITGRSINLEGQVECGGYLRVVEFEGDKVVGKEIKNNVFNEKYKKKELTSKTTVEEMVEILKDDPFVHVVDTVDGIKSFNFTRQAFYDSVWNNQTMTARGLHVDTKNNVIIARSYNKFFNIEEYDIDDLLD